MTRGEGSDKCWDQGGDGPWVGGFFWWPLASESSALLFSFLVDVVCCYCYCYWHFLWEGGWSDTDVTVAVTPDVGRSRWRSGSRRLRWIRLASIGRLWVRRMFLAPLQNCGGLVFNLVGSDIGTAEPVLGPKDKLPTPLQLPWWSLLVDEGREGGGWIELGFVTVRPVSWSHEYY